MRNVYIQYSDGSTVLHTVNTDGVPYTIVEDKDGYELFICEREKENGAIEFYEKTISPAVRIWQAK